MKVCLIVEGAYPYLTGGVSSWIQQMLLRFKDIEFVIQTLAVDRDDVKQIRYKIPNNVSEIHEVYLLDDDEYIKKNKRKLKINKNEYNSLKSLFYGDDVDWEGVFRFFQKEDISLNELLTSKEFFNITKEFYIDNFEDAVFTDFLWTMRSMYLPLFSLLKNKPVEADIYHSLSTGYSGVFGSMAKFLYNKPLIISEHGIYTREREEEIIKANWVKGLYKDIWITQFYKFSTCGYNYADQVTALFDAAKEFQIELGCSKDKIDVISNGVNTLEFKDLPVKDKNNKYINVGAILRLSPIKDVKTMISAFYLAKQKVLNLKLWIMGPSDENPKYANECKQLVNDLGVEDVMFTGKINVKEYIGKMDYLVLSSISEGQPLVMMEGFAAKKPFISTNVGDCFNLIYGLNDNFGDAGIIVPVMNVEEMSQAMIRLAQEEEIRIQMGLNGYKRVKKYYQNDKVFQKYRDIYNYLVQPK